MKHYDNPMESPMAHLSLKMQKIDTNLLFNPTMKISTNSIRDLNHKTNKPTNSKVISNNSSNISSCNSSSSNNNSNLSSPSICSPATKRNTLDNDKFQTPVKRKNKNGMLHTPISNNKLLNSHCSSSMNGNHIFNKDAICKNGRYRGVIISSPKKRLSLDWNLVGDNDHISKIENKPTLVDTDNKLEVKEILQQEIKTEQNVKTEQDEQIDFTVNDDRKMETQEKNFLLPPLRDNFEHDRKSQLNKFNLSLNINNKGVATISNNVNLSSVNLDLPTFASPKKKSISENYLRTPTLPNKSRVNSVSFNLNSNSFNSSTANTANPNNDPILNNNKILFNSPMQLINLNTFSPLQEGVNLDKDKEILFNYMNSNQIFNTANNNNNLHSIKSNYSPMINISNNSSPNKFFGNFANLPTTTQGNTNILLSPRSNAFSNNIFTSRNKSLVSPLKHFFDFNENENKNNDNDPKVPNDDTKDSNDNLTNADDARLALQNLIKH